MGQNENYDYEHFILGKKDAERHDLLRGIAIIWSFLKWCSILAKERRLIIHFNFALERNSILRDFPFILTARLFKYKMVIHLHGGKFLFVNPPNWINWILKIVLTNKEQKIVLSDSEKFIISEKYKVGSIHVLSNCVNLKQARNFKRTNQSHLKKLNLLFLGRIVESKGIQYIYEACALLRRRNVSFTLYMAGKGTDEEKYISKFNSLLGDDFKFRGVVTGDKKISLIKQCDVFLLPSLYEGLPIALLECMSFGLVPITTNVGSIPHLIEDNKNGFIVKKQNSEEIASTILQLNKNRMLLSKISKASKESIFENYDPSSYILKLNSIYSTI